jgi:SAM-dependent methyltransferase
MQESYSTIYADLWRRHWWWRVRHELVMHTVEQLLHGDDMPPAGRTIFDIGCAGGVSFDDLSQYGEVYGLEPDPTLVDACPQWRERIELTGFGPDYSPARQYDLVLMLDVLEHIEDDTVALGSLWHLLKPGGRAILTVPALRTLWSVHDVINHHYRRYDKTGLQRLLEASGFAVRNLQYFFTWPLGLMYLRKLLLGTRQRPGKSYTVTVPSAPVNSLFAGLSRIEQRLMQLGVHWPLGSSLLAVVERSHEQSLHIGAPAAVLDKRSAPLRFPVVMEKFLALRGECPQGSPHYRACLSLLASCLLWYLPC